ncbi:hypothetical protein GQ600_2513 [Phytophthora cactorum]|nr:hypothetical protein GQ600_2513 [Phytophthora cactorum]
MHLDTVLDSTLNSMMKRNAWGWERPDSEKHETKTREVFAHSTENAVRRQSVTNYKYAKQRDSQDTE